VACIELIHRNTIQFMILGGHLDPLSALIPHLMPKNSPKLTSSASWRSSNG
jgi:hypothetical protein